MSKDVLKFVTGKVSCTFAVKLSAFNL